MGELTVGQQAALFVRAKRIQQRAEQLGQSSEAIASGVPALNQDDVAHQQMRDAVADLQRQAAEIHLRADALLDEDLQDITAHPDS